MSFAGGYVVLFSACATCRVTKNNTRGRVMTENLRRYDVPELVMCNASAKVTIFPRRSFTKHSEPSIISYPFTSRCRRIIDVEPHTTNVGNDTPYSVEGIRLQNIKVLWSMDRRLEGT